MRLDREAVLRLVAQHGGPEGLDLSGRDLTGIDLSNVDLHGAILSKADLRGVDLRWADLRDADLSWAVLKDSDLRWASFRGANLSQADLREVQRAGMRRNVLLLTLSDNRHISLPEHLFARRREFDSLVNAIEDRLPPSPFDA